MDLDSILEGVRSDEIRAAIRKLHSLFTRSFHYCQWAEIALAVALLAVVIVIGFGCVSLGQKVETNRRDVKTASDSQHEFDKVMVDVVKQHQLDVASLSNQISKLEVKLERAELTIDQLRSATSASGLEVIATPVPTPAGYDVQIKAVGNRDFGGSALGEFTLVEGTKEKQQAYEELEGAYKKFLENCPFGNSSGHSWNREDTAGVHLYGGGKDYPISDTCFNYIRKIGGVVTDKGLPAAVIQELLKYQATEERVQPGWYNRLVYLSKKDGHGIASIVGASKLPRMNACLEFSLRQAGWTGEGFFVLNLFNLPNEASQILWDNAVFDLEEGVPQMPDFCEAQNLKEVARPVWLGYEVSNDAFSITMGELKARIHTDPKKCDVYPKGWGEDKYLLEVMFDGKYEPIATFGDDNLVLFDARFGEPASMAYLAFEEGAPMWLSPRGEGLALNAFQRLPAIWLNPMVDGMGPWVQLAEHPLVYSVVGRIIEQKPANAVK